MTSCISGLTSELLKADIRKALHYARNVPTSELLSNGKVCYELKTPYRDGTTHVIFEPMDSIAWSDVEPPQAGPKGGGQDARSTSSPDSSRWCLSRGLI